MSARAVESMWGVDRLSTAAVDLWIAEGKSPRSPRFLHSEH